MRQPFGDGKALIFSVRDGLQEPWADVLPVEISNPTALSAEEVLKNHAAMAGFQRFVHSKIPPGDGIERIDDAVEAVRLLVHLRKPAAAENSGELAILLRQDVRPSPSIRTIAAEGAPVLPIAEIRRRFNRAAALWFHAAARGQFAKHLSQHRPPLVHRRGSTLGVHGPLGGVTADGFRNLLGTFRK